VLLGVLVEGPAHGYDLKREHDARFPGAKPLAFPQVYATLNRLERDGFVEVTGTASGGGPERTVYAITPAGRERVREWLSKTEPAGPYPADELVRKAVTALHLGRDAAGFLRRQRQVHMARMRDLLAAQAEAKEPAARITIDHAIAHLDADLKWLENAVQWVTSTKEVRR